MNGTFAHQILACKFQFLNFIAMEAKFAVLRFDNEDILWKDVTFEIVLLSRCCKTIQMVSYVHTWFEDPIVSAVVVAFPDSFFLRGTDQDTEGLRSFVRFIESNI
jgi:hypothetical protein